ncbi:unnamed protein product [Meloidogyne enterolobii]|uniref:Uncharacterized protein n=1 Tax=Meloidogyne enterolobii TaxID=390850 RepID=A0ACB0ZNL5_MELEN
METRRKRGGREGKGKSSGEEEVAYKLEQWESRTKKNGKKRKDLPKPCCHHYYNKFSVFSAVSHFPLISLQLFSNFLFINICPF